MFTFSWYLYMGDPDINQYVPFKVNYVPVPASATQVNGFKPLSPMLTACNASINVSFYSGLSIPLVKCYHLYMYLYRRYSYLSYKSS